MIPKYAILIVNAVHSVPPLFNLIYDNGSSITLFH
jgi:hypothetical protein